MVESGMHVLTRRGGMHQYQRQLSFTLFLTAEFRIWDVEVGLCLSCNNKYLIHKGSNLASSRYHHIYIYIIYIYAVKSHQYYII